MEYTGNIRKMESQLREEIFYNLPLGELKVDMNRLIGQEISMTYKGEIHCIKCEGGPINPLHKVIAIIASVLFLKQMSVS